MVARAPQRSVFAVIAVFFFLNSFQDHPKSEALDLEEKFSGNFVQDMYVKLPVEDVWAVYRRPDFYKLLLQLDPSFWRTVDYIDGDGEVGTLVNITVQPEFGTSYWLDQIMEIDDRKMVRVMRHVRGAFRDAGYTLVQAEYNFIKRGKSSCIIRSISSFGIKRESLSNSSLVRPSWVPATLIVDYINSMQSSPLVLGQEFSGEIVSDMKVNLPAIEIWRVFKSKDFGHLLLKLLPGYYKQLEYVTGNGKEGTVFNITLQPAFGSLNWLEKIIDIDDTTMTRFSQHIQGGFLNSGFALFSSGYKIINEGGKSCVISAFMPFKIRAESLLNASTLGLNWDTAKTIAEHVRSLQI